DVHALGRSVLRDDLLGDVREEHHAVLVPLTALLDDEAGRADTFHDAHRFHHVDVAVDECDIRAHHVADGDVVLHICSSNTPASFSAWATTPTASSTSIWNAMPVPGLASNCPTSRTCSRILLLRCSSTIMRRISRG